jgi:aldose 1-epimerase
MSKKTIGQYEGKPVENVSLSNAAGMTAEVMTWGAVVRDMHVPHRGKQQRVVLGFETFDPYPQHSPHFGAIAGRFANRINRGVFRLDGRKVQVTLNQNDPPGPGGVPKHHLHGGKAGFGKRNWTITHLTDDSVTLTLVSPDGEEGYPGTLTVNCTYTLVAPATLRVLLTATTDKATIVNLCHHSYFNLDGSADIKDHLLTLDAEVRTPTDKDLIPTGEVLKVSRTPYDFRRAKPMGQMIRGERMRYDANFPRNATGFGRCARVESTVNGLTLECWTDQPAIQFYDGAKINTQPKGLGGVGYGSFAGFCLEPQRFPDSPNHPHFSDATLRPSDVYRQLTEYRFG